MKSFKLIHEEFRYYYTETFDGEKLKWRNSSNCDFGKFETRANCESEAYVDIERMIKHFGGSYEWHDGDIIYKHETERYKSIRIYKIIEFDISDLI